MFLCFMKEKNAYKTKNNLITQQAETNRKWIENEHLPIYTLFESLSLKEAFFWMDIKKTIWFFFFFWGKVNLRTSTYIVYKSTAPANIKCGDFGTVL